MFSIFSFSYIINSEISMVSAKKLVPDKKVTNSPDLVKQLWNYKETPPAKGGELSYWSLSQGGFMDGLAFSAS
jgi:hypothetical protein